MEKCYSLRKAHKKGKSGGREKGGFGGLKAGLETSWAREKTANTIILGVLRGAMPRKKLTEI